MVWENCKMVDNRLVYLGAGFSEDAVSGPVTERGAREQIRDGRWDLIAVVSEVRSGEPVNYSRLAVQGTNQRLSGRESTS